MQFAAILTDITERKFAEKALKTSEYNFRNIFESSSDPILITLDNKVIDCNLAMIELLGYDSKSSILHKIQFSFLQRNSLMENLLKKSYSGI